MNYLTRIMRESPVAARFAPYFIFVLLIYTQDAVGESGRYWIYLLRTLAGVCLIWMMRPLVKEMRWAMSWEAVVVGVAVVVMWVFLGDWVRKMHPLEDAKLWNPFRQFPAEPALAWFFVAVRTLGSTFVVPPLEETFFRSYVNRAVANKNFEALPLNYFSWPSLLLTAVLFAAVHHPTDWPGAILCAIAYQWLVIRKNRLGDAMTAHAITNFLLSVWSVWQQDWRFW